MLDAAKAMKLSAKDLFELKIIDEVINEPTGGAHRDKNKILEKTIKKVATRATRDKVNHIPEKLVTIPASPKTLPSTTRNGAASIGPSPKIIMPNTVCAEFRISSSAMRSTYIKVTPMIGRIGMERFQKMRERVAREITTTFASKYTQEISFEEMLDPCVDVYSRIF